MQVLICYYSLYGHVYKLARALAEGVSEAGATPLLRRVAETLPDDVLAKMHASPPEVRGADQPVVQLDDLVNSAGIIFGSPTRFGGMCGQMRAFLDQTGGLWANRKLVGKVASAFTSTNTQHGGHELTIFSFHTFMLHHGMLIAGIPFDSKGLNVSSEVCGGTPYGAGAIAASDGTRQPTELELQVARDQGRFVAGCAIKMAS